VELVWDGEIDTGTRRRELLASLNKPPAGVLVFLDDSGLDISTQSAWAFATWAVTALMIWFGLTSDNWFLLVLAPFMAGAAIMQSLGQVRIRIKDEELDIFEGVAGVGRRIRTLLSAIERVEYFVKRGRGGSTTWIVLHQGDRRVKFGRFLNDAQERFVIAFVLSNG
jgi:hypothetical protein